MQVSHFYKELDITEKLISDNNAKSEYIRQYENLSKNMEDFIAAQGPDERHHIMLVIPVADRPQHLQSCLESVYCLCEDFNYGGKGQYFNKVSVLVAEDSHKISCRDKNKNITESFSQRGLRSIYFGLDEQRTILTHLSLIDKNKLGRVVGYIYADDFSHKGASITRNITYLKLNQLKDDFENIIFYFIDSDQEFKVNPVTDNGDTLSYSLNYFYHLDRIFSHSHIKVLTGKVVGDPPVSPSVMAANFLKDVCSFLLAVSDCKLDDPCCFHDSYKTVDASDAAYHDMADLFGFKIKDTAFNYFCDIKTPHSNGDCLNKFSNKVNEFFDGVHLTRKSYYKYENITESIITARTVYTGNFALSKQALKYFIPFANLKLRMAGPTMGRLLKHNIGEKFVSANLPMLHERTVDNIGQSEFRSGVQHNQNSINLHDEFERQYFGDVMLFSVEELIDAGYPDKYLDQEEVREIVLNKEEFLGENYSKKLGLVQDNIKKLKSICNDIAYKDNNMSNNIDIFIKNMELNFSKKSFPYQLVTNDNSTNPKIKDIIDALMSYKDETTLWSQLLES